MYTIKNVMIPHNISDIGNLKTINSNINRISTTERFNPTLINFGNDIYLSKDASYKNFNTSGTSFHYYKNLISSRGGTSALYFNAIADQIEKEPILKIFSSYTINSIYGQKTTASHILIDRTDVDNSVIYSPTSSIFKTFLTNMPITIDSQYFKSTHIIYIDRSLGMLPLMPKIERLVYPLSSYYYANIKEKVEKENTSIYTLKTFKEPSVYESIDFYRPLYLFSSDGVTWKRWNSSTFIEVRFENTSPTYDEFIAIGNTYDEMISLTDANWNLLLDIDDDIKATCWVLCNSYVPIIEVSHEAAELDTTEFLSIYNRVGRYVIQKGCV